MNKQPEVPAGCEVCGLSLRQQHDGKNEVHELTVRRLLPTTQDQYNFVLCSACIQVIVIPLLKAWFMRLTSAQITSIREQMAEFGLDMGSNR